MTYARPMFPPPVGVEGDHVRRGVNDDVTRAQRRRHPLAVLMQLRQQAADEIERLLDFLDATEGPDDLEPSHGRCMASDEVDEAEGDYADDEPWLGAPEPALAWNDDFEHHRWLLDQDRGFGGAEDVELDTSDLEPSLAGLTVNPQFAADHDLEGEGDDEEHEPSGIADLEGLLEQLAGMTSCSFPEVRYD